MKLETTLKENADMIILTGDLFTNPSPNIDTCLFACQKMRQLVSAEPLRHKLECGRGKNNVSPFYTLNYPENPQWELATFKVQMPVISLYGKKDRPILQPNMPTPGISFDVCLYNGNLSRIAIENVDSKWSDKYFW